MDFDPAQAAAAQQIAARRQQMLSGALAGQPQMVAFFTKPMDPAGAAPMQAAPNVSTPGTASIPEMPGVTQKKKPTNQATPTNELPSGLDIAGGPAYG